MVGYQQVMYYSVNGKKQESSSILIGNIQNVSFLTLCNLRHLHCVVAKYQLDVKILKVGACIRCKLDLRD